MISWRVVVWVVVWVGCGGWEEDSLRCKVVFEEEDMLRCNALWKCIAPGWEEDTLRCKVVFEQEDTLRCNALLKCIAPEGLWKCIAPGTHLIEVGFDFVWKGASFEVVQDEVTVCGR